MHIKLLTKVVSVFQVNLLLDQPWFRHRNFFKTQGWNLCNWSQNETNASFFKDIVKWQNKWRRSYFSGWTISEFKNQIKLSFLSSNIWHNFIFWRIVIWRIFLLLASIIYCQKSFPINICCLHLCGVAWTWEQIKENLERMVERDW